ncbi:MAG: cytochrome c biogenesis protein CcsA [Candidatus Sumerlaeia bacterium]
MAGEGAGPTVKLLEWLGSYGLACALLLGLFALTLAGTLEQGGIGLYRAQQKYFESLVVWAGPAPVFPGGLTLMALLGVNLVAGAFVRRRTGLGLYLVHGGVLLLLAGGMFSRRFADEGRVFLSPGETAGSFESRDEWEVAVSDTSRPDRDFEYIIDQKEFVNLPGGGRSFRDAALPFEIGLSHYMVNCAPRETPGARDQIDAYTLAALPPEKENELNTPGLRVTVSEAGNSKTADRETGVPGAVREGFVWGLERGPWVFEAQGKTWSVALRRRQWALPFSLGLARFAHETHPGTSIPSAYQSDLVVTDAGARTPATIRMNEPLRYRGYTFFQSSYLEDAGKTTTVLAVVRNPLERLPLWASALITIGLFLHFGRRLSRHLKRVSAACLACLWIGSVHAADPILTPRNVKAFGSLPIQDGGRVKPISTFARFKLIQFSGRSTLDGEPATSWLMRVVLKPETALDDNIFLIENPRLMQALGLSDDKRRARFSYAELMGHRQALIEQAQAAYAAGSRDLVQRQALDLFQNVMEFQSLATAMEFMLGPGRGESTSPGLAMIPPADPGRLEWWTPEEVTWRSEHGETPAEPEVAIAKGLAAIEKAIDSPERFTAELAALAREASAAAAQRADARRLGLEGFYYRADFFGRALAIYVLGFVLVALSWLTPRRKLAWRGGVTLTAAATALVIAGIVIRCIIRGRPPVTNLYETTLFIPAAAAAIALGAEWFDRRRIAAGLGALLGAAGLFIANRYEIKDGADTMGSLVAVLNSNFWLATHVTTVTLGYSAGLLAGALGHIYIFAALMRGRGKPEFLAGLARMTYGVVCFALLFSLLGTVLGGVWANDNWGRFWGWDPKENGALLIVLWCLAIVHARKGGYIKQTGIALSAVGLAMVVVFSWWGVNLLGVGLHSYGFTSGILGWLVGYWVVEAGVIGLGAIRSLTTNEIQHTDGDGSNG